MEYDSQCYLKKDVILSLYGLPSKLNSYRKEWELLSDENDLCIIELVLPNKIAIKYQDGTLIGCIPFTAQTSFSQQSPENILLQTSQGIYGIVVADISNVASFLTALHDMVENLKQQVKTSIIPPLLPQQSPQPQYGLERPSYENVNQMASHNKKPLPKQPRALHSKGQLPQAYQEHAQQSSGSSFPYQNHNQFLNQQQNLTLPVAAMRQNYVSQADNDPDSRWHAVKATNKAPRVSKEEVNSPPTEEEIACDLLSEAIEKGNIQQAQEAVIKLASMNSKLTVQLLQHRDTPDKPHAMNIIINIEDKDSETPLPVLCSVDSAMTVRMLKYKICKDYKFPVSIQRFIIDDRLANDHETLDKAGVKVSGTEIFLYLVSAENAKVHAVSTQTESFASSPNPMMGKNTLNSRQSGTVLGLNFLPELVMAGDLSNMDAPQISVKPRMPQMPGWHCPKCTYKNPPLFPGCKMCSEGRPESYLVPHNYRLTPEEDALNKKQQYLDQLAIQHEKKRKQKEANEAALNYYKTLEHVQKNLLPNALPFDCSICYTNVPNGEGVMLRECLHCFCKDCLAETIKASEDPEVHCPYNEGYPCPAIITGQEIKELLSDDDFVKFLDRSLAIAENHTENSFHCRSPNCKGWCVYEDDVNHFDCPVCGLINCLTCKAIHKDLTCKQYQDELNVKAQNDEDAKKTQVMLQELITRGEAMYCPKCKIILQKKSGCDWMKCTMCLTEICWATKGSRWGPGGNGDTSGGCKCNVNGQRCTPTCGNCH